MSWQSAEEPEVVAPPACKALQHVIVPRPRDLGGFEVRRVLPAPERHSVGPFVFFDQMGPAELAPRAGYRRAARIRTSAWPRSPICLPARSFIAIVSAACKPSSLARSTG